MNRDVIGELINRRQRQILVHSCIYYRHGTSIITDQQFDKWAKELVKLQEEHLEIAVGCVYAEYFKGFDGTTGYDLPTWLPEIERKAQQLIEYHKSENENEFKINFNNI